MTGTGDLRASASLTAILSLLSTLCTCNFAGFIGALADGRIQSCEHIVLQDTSPWPVALVWLLLPPPLPPHIPPKRSAPVRHVLLPYKHGAGDCCQLGRQVPAIGRRREHRLHTRRWGRGGM